MLVDIALRKFTLKIQSVKFQENASNDLRQHTKVSDKRKKMKQLKAEAMKASKKFAEDQARLEERQTEHKKENAVLVAEMTLYQT